MKASRRARSSSRHGRPQWSAEGASAARARACAEGLPAWEVEGRGGAGRGAGAGRSPRAASPSSTSCPASLADAAASLPARAATTTSSSPPPCLGCDRLPSVLGPLAAAAVAELLLVAALPLEWDAGLATRSPARLQASKRSGCLRWKSLSAGSLSSSSEEEEEAPEEAPSASRPSSALLFLPFFYYRR